MKHIPFVDLTRQYKVIKKDVNLAINRVLEKTDFILGDDVALFEKEFAKFCDTKYAVGVDTGFSALELGLRAMNIGEGDEVIVPVNTFIASALAVSACGATPVLVDCKEDTYNIDLDLVEHAITKRTKAIMLVHLYGQIADIEKSKKLSQKYKIPIIEDACQAHGAKYRNKKAGSIGVFAAFSFYPGKNLGAYGDGGILTTNKREIATAVSQFRNYGQKKKYDHNILGWNRRLDTIHAAVLRIKLKKLDFWNKKRINNANLYSKLLMDFAIKIPQVPKGMEHIFHLYVIRVAKRDQLAAYLNSEGIATGIHYPKPIHLQKAYMQLGYKKGDFPVSEKVSSDILSLPMFPELTKKEIRFICKKIKEFYQ